MNYSRSSSLSTFLSFVSLSLILFFASSCKDLEDVSFYTSISGTVYDASTAEVLNGVNVTLSPLGDSQLTKENGSFVFDNLDVQQYTLIFQKTGYKPKRKNNVTTIVGEDTYIEILLEKIEY